MKYYCTTLLLSLLFIASNSSSAALPADVKADHPAAKAIERMLSMHVLSAPGGKFSGATAVSRTELASVLRQMAVTIAARKWKVEKSVPLTAKGVFPLIESGTWTKQHVSRYTMAISLARVGDYFENGMHRAAPGLKDTGKSETKLFTKPTIPSNHPAKISLNYLAAHKMLWKDSPLLQVDNTNFTAKDFSFAVAQMIVGLNDQLTSLNLDEKGESKDATFHQKKKK